MICVPLEVCFMRAMTISYRYHLVDSFQIIFILTFFILYSRCHEGHDHGGHEEGAPQPWIRPNKNIVTKKLCLQMDQTLRAKHKTCFLRPDTGPCRADIVQWYFDIKQRKCYRFFWGGCQGNGNRFDSKKTCMDYCVLTQGNADRLIPHFCTMSFDYGTCFGHYSRWAWDTYSQSCKVHLYSGCGGNQNNFHSLPECRENCVIGAKNSLMKSLQVTTCIPINMDDMN